MPPSPWTASLDYATLFGHLEDAMGRVYKRRVICIPEGTPPLPTKLGGTENAVKLFRSSEGMRKNYIIHLRSWWKFARIHGASSGGFRQKYLEAKQITAAFTKAEWEDLHIEMEEFEKILAGGSS